jgi:hypothetical protein
LGDHQMWKSWFHFHYLPWVIAYPYHPLVTCSCLMCVLCALRWRTFVFHSFGPCFICIFIITTYIHLAPCPPLLTCQFITKPIILLLFLFFVLPSNGRRRRLGKFWEWKDWVFLEHWEELEHACNCNFLRAPLLKLCIKWHYF